MGCPENVQIMSDEAVTANFLQRYLKKPIYFDRRNNALRVIFPSAQLVTLSGTNTVATVTTLNQKAGLALEVTELRYEMKDRWQNAVRRNM